ncbi:flagellar hook-length control protein FliK [Rossellomorea marisflavi]|uniref:flagellar hook-length control protein FliK n=1 Tax=Rossellomorea marisflavi TaxID=189381 RepID=UPI001652D296|nr:flagellar hook-length control protein FliK [Rossellomorea marisflavi]
MQINPLMNQLGALSSSSQAQGETAAGEGAIFTSQLLGFLGQIQEGGMMPDAAEKPSLLKSLQLLLQTDSLSSLGISEEEVEAQSGHEEITMEDMAEMLGIDVETLQAYHTDLLKEMHVMPGKIEPPDDLRELVAGILQLSKELPTEMKSQPLEQAVKLIRAMELLSAAGKSEWNSTYESIQIKEALKELLVRMEGSGQGASQKEPELKAGNQVEKMVREVPSGVNAFQPSTSVQGTATMKASLFLKPEQPESFVQQFQNLLGKSQFSSMGSMSKLFIKLYPEHLGSVRIELLQQNGVMTAKIMASSASAKEMLDSHLQGLKQAFHSQNIQVDKIELSQSLSDPERAFRGQSQQQSKEHGQKQDGQEREPDSDTDFKELLIKNEQVIT